MNDSKVEYREHPSGFGPSWGVSQAGKFYPFGEQQFAREIVLEGTDLAKEAYIGFPLENCLLGVEDAPQ